MKVVKRIMTKLPGIVAGAGLHTSEEPLQFQILILKSKFKVSIYSDWYTSFSIMYLYALTNKNLYNLPLLGSSLGP